MIIGSAVFFCLPPCGDAGLLSQKTRQPGGLSEAENMQLLPFRPLDALILSFPGPSTVRKKILYFFALAQMDPSCLCQPICVQAHYLSQGIYIEDQVKWACQTRLYWYLKLKSLVGRASGRARSRGQDVSSAWVPLSGCMVAFIVLARWLPAAPRLTCFLSGTPGGGRGEMSLFIQRPVIE